ncbi:MAG: hypothetical protein ACUVQ8_04855 [Nitrososphaeria archaeon]
MEKRASNHKIDVDNMISSLKSLIGDLKARNGTERFLILLVVLYVVSLLLLAWAPWLDNEEVYDRILKERGKVDGTIQPFENIVASEEALNEMIDYSIRHGVTEGIMVCDYEVTWFPFDRWVASCEGAYYVTFYGQIIP